MTIALRTLRLSGLLAALVALSLWLRGAPTNAQGLLIGAFLALFSIGSFTALAWLIGKPGGANGGFGGIVALVFLMKLPLFWVGISLARRLGDSAVSCFLVGLGLVYFVLVFVAILDSRAKSQGPF